MHRLGKVLLGSTAVAALLSGAVTLPTTQASAQVNIDGLIRGALHEYNRHYRHRGHHGRTHEARHGRHHRQHEAKDEDSGKDKHSGDDGDQANNKPDRRQFSSHPKETPQTDASAGNQPPPQQPKPNGDVPSFTPEK